MPGNATQSDSAPRYVCHIACFGNSDIMTSVARPSRALQRWALLLALLSCVGLTAADTHVHLDEHQEEVCTYCAIPETGQLPEVGCLDAQPSQWRHSNSLLVVSATLSPRPYELALPRAPPIS